MKKVLLPLIFILMLIQATSANAELSRLHVEGKYLKNEYNQTIYLTGVAMTDRAGPPCTYWRQLPMKERISKCKEWGVRPFIWYWTKWTRWYGLLNVSNELCYDNYEYPGQSYPWADGNVTRYIEDYRNIIDKDMKLFYDNDFYVLIKNDQGPTTAGVAPEWNPLTNSTVRQMHINYYKELTQRYYNKYKNIIGFEVWNEPGWFGFGDINTLRAEWRSFIADIARAVHEIAPDAIIFAPEAGLWTYNGRTFDFFGTGPIEKSVGYSYSWYYKYTPDTDYFKVYNSSNPVLGKQLMDKWHYDRALKLTDYGFPIISEEWGFLGGPTGQPGETGGGDVSNPSVYEPDWATVMQDYIDILEKYGVGWTYFDWGFGGGRLPNGTLVTYGRNALFTENESGLFIAPTIKFDIWLRNLKPYLKYVKFNGILKDKDSNPINANITLYHKPTANTSITLTDSKGYYSFSIPASTYDAQYNIDSFYIKVSSVEMEKDLTNLIFNFTKSSNKLSFKVNSTNKTIQVYSEAKPTRISSGSNILQEVSSLSALTSNTWYYDSQGKKLYILVKCPTCPNPSAWSSCSNEEQTRTSYRCGEETDYTCQVYAEKRYCSVDPSLIGRWHLDENSGNTAIDTSGYGNNGTIYGANWITDCKSGYCLRFDGTNDYIEISDSSSLAFQNEFAIGLWAKPSKQLTNYANWINKEDFLRWYSTGNDYLGGYTYINNTWQSNPSINLNNYYGKLIYIVLQVRNVAGSKYIDVYVNGSLIGTKGPYNGSITTSKINWFIGSKAGVDAYNGIIDEIRVWNRSLTAEEIASYAT